MRMALIGVLVALGAAPGVAQHAHGEGGGRPYAGLETRAIPGLSAQDIDALRAGEGWGLALPAELGGWPGPAHVLELADELGLSADQRAAFDGLFTRMQAEAIAAGEALIAAEAALGAGFDAPDLDVEQLAALVTAAAEARGALRLVHLSYHLQTPDLLSAEQVAAYMRLRGYTSDPCNAVPEGHDPAMWRRHNGCD